MKNLKEICETIQVQIDESNLNLNLSNFIGVDIYGGQEKLSSNIIYISDKIIEQNNIAVIYLNYIKEINFEQDYIFITSINEKEILIKLNRYFLGKETEEQNALSLFSTLINDKGVKEIISIAAKILNNPIILTNSAYKVLAYDRCHATFEDPIFDNAVKFGYCDAPSISNFENQGVTSAVLTSSKPFIHNTGFSQEIPRILDKVVIKDKIVAFIGIFEVNRKFTKQDIETTETICKVLGNVISKDKSLLETTNVIYESLIIDLLKDKIDNVFILNERLQASSWTLQKNIRLVSISTHNKNKHIDNTIYLCNHISSNYNLKSIIYDNFILAIASYNTLEEWQDIIQFIEKEAKILNVKVGVSTAFSSLLELHSHYEETTKALEIAESLKAKDTVFYFSELLPYFLISSCNEKVLKKCANIAYSKLYEYDNLHNTDYLETLYYYILFNCSINDTAKKLCLHRNTLAHRIERIQEIAELNLSNGVLLQNYVLFYQIQYYKKKIESK